MRRLVLALLLIGCSAPTDERATLDGSMARARCESCHVSDFESADDPPHSGELPATCFVCHTQTAWAPAHLEHDFYPLTGAHLETRCFGCHRMGNDDNEPQFEGTRGECVHCHRDDYDRSEFPGHAHFALTCGDCHSTEAWEPTLHGLPDAWVPMPDAGVGDLLDQIGSASQWGGAGRGGGLLEPPPPLDAGTDAGRRRRPPRRPPPTTTETPPPTTVEEEVLVPDITSRPSHRGR